MSLSSFLQAPSLWKIYLCVHQNTKTFGQERMITSDHLFYVSILITVTTKAVFFTDTSTYVFIAFLTGEWNHYQIVWVQNGKLLVW